jgi:membrane protease YdiL (CAAX protease family)
MLSAGRASREFVYLPGSVVCTKLRNRKRRPSGLTELLVFIKDRPLISFIQKELKGIYLFLQRNRVEAVVIGSATLFLTLDKYHPIRNEWFSSALYFAVLPIMIIVVLLRSNPLDFGLGFGNPRIWGRHVAIACLAIVTILYAASLNPSFQTYYRIEHFSLAKYFLVNCVTLSALEFLLRGFLLFGLKGKLGEGSIALQMIPFVLIHFGKPELETLSTIITGLYFGYVAYRGKSFWPAFIIHLFINVFFVALVNLA